MSFVVLRNVLSSMHFFLVVDSPQRRALHPFTPDFIGFSASAAQPPTMTLLLGRTQAQTGIRVSSAISPTFDACSSLLLALRKLFVVIAE